MKRHNFVLRTIKNGRVKIDGEYFYPEKRWKEYDGRLDGMRYAFGLYWTGYQRQDYVTLWGSEKVFNSPDGGASLPDDMYCGPEVMEDGTIPWGFWYIDPDNPA